MRTIELQKGETIKITGQREAHLVITNVGGSIYTKTSWNRDKETEETKQEDSPYEKHLKEGTDNRNKKN